MKKSLKLPGVYTEINDKEVEYMEGGGFFTYLTNPTYRNTVKCNKECTKIKKEIPVGPERNEAIKFTLEKYGF